MQGITDRHIETYEEVLSVKNPRPLTCVDCKNNFIAYGDDHGTIQCYDSVSGVFLEPKIGHEGPVTSVSLDRDATLLVSTGEDHNVIFWRLIQDSEERMDKRIVKEHYGVVLSSAIAPNGQLMATGGADGDIILWGSLGRPISRRLRGHSNWVNSLAFSHDSKTLISCDHNGAIGVWDTERHFRTRTIHLQSAIVSVSFSHDSSLILCSCTDYTARIFRIMDGLPLLKFEGHEDVVRGFITHKKGLFVSISMDQTIRLWNPKGRCVHIFEAHRGGITGFSLNGAGNLLTTVGTDGYFKLWSLTVTENMFRV
eukprot:PhF_6_TR4316/c0_g1_i1/m.5820